MKKKSVKLIAVLLSILTVISSLPFSGMTVEAAAKPKLVKKSAKIAVGATTKIMVKNMPKGAKVSYKSAKKTLPPYQKKAK